MQNIFKKLLFQNIFILSIFFIDIITPVSSFTKITCDVMCVQHEIQ